jgi:hypothetical protein
VSADDRPSPAPPALARPIDQALDRIVVREDDFSAVLMALYRRRYSGALTIHFRNGQPRTIELPGVQVTLTTEPA